LSLKDILAKNTRLRRNDLGLSQEELAYRCGRHRTYIGAIERGERNVTLLTVEAIAKALGCDAIQLLTRDAMEDGQYQRTKTNSF
jgi:transcriptional regulator with XRE-family HTH domain